MITSHVATYHGVPTLHINGKPVASPAYITYLPERNDYANMARCGIHLYSITLYFGRKTINEVHQIHPFADGIFDLKGKSDFSIPDREIHRILEADPQALIFPRVNIALPTWWEEDHPEELNDHGINGHAKRPSFASRLWLETIDDGLRQLVAHVEASDYADHIFGYQIAGGNTEEWFPFDQAGSISKRAREGFEASPYAQCAPEQREAAYYEYMSHVTVEDIAYLCRKMKEYTHHQLVIGSFYGYTLECPRRSALHGALVDLLTRPEIDFLCSPASYAQTRRMGIDHACMTVLDSLLLHGKVYFTEVDERTHRTRLLQDCRSDSVEPGTYDKGVWFGPESPLQGRHILRNDFCRQLIHGTHYWWFDMWGQWYQDPAIYADFTQEQTILQKALEDPDRGIHAEAAVFIDEKSHYQIDSGYDVQAVQCRIPLGSCGVPYAIYDISDFEQVYRNYRAFVLICPARTPGMQQVMDQLTSEGLPFMVVDNETDVTPSVFREYFAAHGLHVYNDQDDVIYANPHWVSIYAASDGDKIIKLPSVQKVIPQFDSLDGDVEITDHIHLPMQAFTTCLFRLEEV